MSFERKSLETERMFLRPWRLSDIDAAFEYGSNPDWGRYLWNTPFPYTRKHAEDFVIASVAAEWTEEARWALTLDGQVVGGIRLYLTDVAGKVAGMGYNVAADQWGKGLATEAGAIVLQYGFEDWRLHKVHASVDTRNLASIRVLQKLGMSHEGTLRDHRLHRGEYVDEAHYGVLARERDGPK